jgi:uncharacterized membrane protein
VFNTTAFAIIAIVAVYCIYWLVIKKLKLKIDEEFFFATIPYIMFAAFLRVIQDAALLPREVVVFGASFFPFITPGIYFLAFFVLAACFAASWLYDKKAVVKNTATAGWLFAAASFLVLFSKLSFPNFTIGAGIVALAAGCALLFWLVYKQVFRKRPEKIEFAVVLGQCVDGAATFLGVGFAGYSEQHVVGNAVIGSLGGPFAFFMLKLLFAFAVVYVTRREFSQKPEEQQARVFLLLLITIFGLGPGMRDLCRIILGV